MTDARERARRVRLMGFDVDGVLTDGTLYYDAAGVEAKAFHTLDGLGLKLLREAGVVVALISGRRSGAVATRAAELGLAEVFEGVDDKLRVLEALRARHGVTLEECGFMGDDLPDLPLLVRCGFAASVPDAPSAVRSRVHYVSRAPGGRGAVREVADLLLDARGALAAAVERFLS